MRYFVGTLMLLFASQLPVHAQQSDETRVDRRSVVKVRFSDEAITPATARFLDRALDHADAQRAECLVVELDTPGGLLDSTRYIVKRILGSRTPVVIHVAPAGSRAASAGVFITLSSHVAAMAPGTTIGAAHPVQIGGLPIGPQQPEDGSPTAADDAKKDTSSDTRNVMSGKIVNDTVAWARSLAGLRGRNAEWAADAVTNSVSITAEEALDKNVVDLVVEDTAELLQQLDGREVETAFETRTLMTADADVQLLSMWWGEQLLSLIARPNVAFLLLVLGFYGILFELYSPGWGVSGTLGIVCLLLGSFGLSVLPVNYLGLALLAVACGLFVAELFVTSYGALAVAGTICLVLGGVMLVDSPAGFSRVSLNVVLPVAVATLSIVSLLVVGIVRSHRRRVQTGSEGLMDEPARTLAAFVEAEAGYSGPVIVHGERWKGVCDQPLKLGQACQVYDRQGLTLFVKPVA